MVVSQEKWNATSVKVTQLEADLATSRSDHAALCKAVEDWDKAHEALDHTMTEEAFADGVSAVTNARDYMLKLAKDGNDGTD